MTWYRSRHRSPNELDELGELSAVVADAFADLRTGNTRNGIV